MPYECDTGSVRIELNITYVKEMLEEFEKKKVNKDYDLCEYVKDLEDQLWADFENGFNYSSLEDWFEKNYEESNMFEDIEWDE